MTEVHCLMNIIKNIIADLYRIIGSIICHQLPSRTLHIKGTPLPLCARDTGIYTGFFISLVYIYLNKRNKADLPPNIKNTVFLCFLMLFMIIDGGTSYMGIRETSNVLRYFSGAFFGLALPFFLVPVANYKQEAVNTNISLKSTLEIILLLIVNIAIGLLILKTETISWFLISTIIIGTLIYVIGRIVFIICKRMGLLKNHNSAVLVAGGTIGVLIIMFCFSNFVLQPLKNLLLYNMWR